MGVPGSRLLRWNNHFLRPHCRKQHNMTAAGVMQRLVRAAVFSVAVQKSPSDVETVTASPTRVVTAGSRPPVVGTNLSVAEELSTLTWQNMRVELVTCHLEVPEGPSGGESPWVGGTVGAYLLLYPAASLWLPAYVFDVGICSPAVDEASATLEVGVFGELPGTLGGNSDAPTYVVRLRAATAPAPSERPRQHRLAHPAAAAAATSSLSLSSSSLPRARALQTLFDWERQLYTTKAALSGLSARYVLAVRELVDTEAAYVRDLHTMVRAFIQPLRDAAKVGILPHLPSQFIADTFSNTEVLLQINASLLQELRRRLQGWRAYSWHSTEPAARTPPVLALDDIGRVFQSKAFLFHLYSEYCLNFVERSEYLERCLREDAALRDFVARCEASDMCRGERLGSFFIKPVQRLTRYGLLLKQIMVECGGRACYPTLCEAERRLCEIVELANRRQEAAEQSRALADLAAACGFDARILRSGRRVVRAEHLEYAAEEAGGTKARQSRRGQLVLFNDALALLRPTSSIHGNGAAGDKAPAYAVAWLAPLSRLHVQKLRNRRSFRVRRCLFLSGDSTKAWLDAFEAAAERYQDMRVENGGQASPATHNALEFEEARAGLRRRRVLHGVESGSEWGSDDETLETTTGSSELSDAVAGV